jgi:hypothetical protein
LGLGFGHAELIHHDIDGGMTIKAASFLLQFTCAR